MASKKSSPKKNDENERNLSDLNDPPRKKQYQPTKEVIKESMAGKTIAQIALGKTMTEASVVLDILEHVEIGKEGIITNTQRDLEKKVHKG